MQYRARSEYSVICRAVNTAPELWHFDGLRHWFFQNPESFQLISARCSATRIVSKDYESAYAPYPALNSTRTRDGDIMPGLNRTFVIPSLVLVLLGTMAAQTQNYVAKFNTGGTIVNSSLFDNGNLGIGTAAPRNIVDIIGSNAVLNIDNRTFNAGTVGLQLLHVNGEGNQQKVAIFSDATGYWGKGNLRFAVNTIDNESNVSLSDTRLFIDANTGNIGVATTTPGQKLEVNGNLKLSAGSGGRLYFPDGTSQGSAATGTITGVLPGGGLTGGGYSGTVVLGVDSTVARLNQNQTFSGVQTFVTTATAFGANFYNNNGGDVIRAICYNANWITGYCMRLDSYGILHSINFSSNPDFAESVVPSGDKQGYGPGDVLVIDATDKQRFTVTNQPYSRLVAGVYSTQPGFVGSSHPLADIKSIDFSREVPMAVVGIVPCKVSDENGPILAGDLLVTSSIPGFAMRGTDPNRLVGAVVGKALEPLQSGKGAIQILVSLQ